ncbi:hypothetical protein HMP0015_0674 [Acinetobacter haemolyticus ATCC 19194]|uniref:Uncharacterized protein n=1 Tax=Acinetobacter haemolyticus ATCC 19194 TaxID=707232 RepID=D4XLT2_ACIHA|nr:hypothetical protein HMP0015_0674 [Acinetobacter haemolyticus ATCC 19194]
MHSTDISTSQKITPDNFMAHFDLLIIEKLHLQTLIHHAYVRCVTEK